MILNAWHDWTTILAKNIDGFIIGNGRPHQGDMKAVSCKTFAFGEIWNVLQN